MTIPDSLGRRDEEERIRSAGLPPNQALTRKFVLHYGAIPPFNPATGICASSVKSKPKNAGHGRNSPLSRPSA